MRPTRQTVGPALFRVCHEIVTESADATQRRLVLYRTEHGTEAALYPVDATAFSRPEWVFSLEPGQPLPNQQPGDVVAVEGPLAPGAQPRVRAADTEITVAGGLRRHAFHGDRIFAERGDVVAHPQAIGWDTSWRHVVSPSRSSLSEWQHKVRKALAGAALTWLLLFAYLAFAAWRLSNGDRVRPLGPAGVFGAGVAIASGAYALRARRALRGARRLLHRGSRPMKMRLWWAAGGAEGPMAMAALFPPDAHQDTSAVAHVPVVNVPPRLVTEHLVDVAVFGDPDDTPVIQLGETYLWPAQASYT